MATTQTGSSEADLKKRAELLAKGEREGVPDTLADDQKPFIKSDVEPDPAQEQPVKVGGSSEAELKKRAEMLKKGEREGVPDTLADASKPAIAVTTGTTTGS